jgi:hypothetical protein
VKEKANEDYLSRTANLVRDKFKAATALTRAGSAAALLLGKA